MEADLVSLESLTIGEHDQVLDVMLSISGDYLGSCGGTTLLIGVARGVISATAEKPLKPHPDQYRGIFPE